MKAVYNDNHNTVEKVGSFCVSSCIFMTCDQFYRRVNRTAVVNLEVATTSSLSVVEDSPPADYKQPISLKRPVHSTTLKVIVSRPDRIIPVPAGRDVTRGMWPSRKRITVMEWNIVRLWRNPQPAAGAAAELQLDPVGIIAFYNRVPLLIYRTDN